MPIITIQGPTAVGKSQLAMKLAATLQTEILSADSRQIYRFMDIGTAKPSSKELSEMKHHFIDIITPDVRYNAGSFAKTAKIITKELISKKQIPIIVGGTGFYIKSLLDGLFQIPIISDEIKKILELEFQQTGFQSMLTRLKKVDSDSAERIALNDRNRLLRALEVYEATGKTISQHWKEQHFEEQFLPFQILITEDRNEIYKRINERVLQMLEKGLIIEFQMLIEKGYNKTSPGMNSVGYKELFAFMEGEKTLPKCIEDIQQHTRNYAKRQFTWYRNQNFDLTFQASNINFSKIQQKIQEWIYKSVGSLI